MKIVSQKVNSVQVQDMVVGYLTTVFQNEDGTTMEILSQLKVEDNDMFVESTSRAKSMLDNWGDKTRRKNISTADTVSVSESTDLKVPIAAPVEGAPQKRRGRPPKSAQVIETVVTPEVVQEPTVVVQQAEASTVVDPVVQKVEDAPVVAETTIESTPVVAETTIESTPVVAETTIESTPVVAETTIESTPVVQEIESTPEVKSAPITLPVDDDDDLESEKITEAQKVNILTLKGEIKDDNLFEQNIFQTLNRSVSDWDELSMVDAARLISNLRKTKKTLEALATVAE